MKLGLLFELEDGNFGKITEMFSQGFHYHTMDREGNCVKGQQYMLKSDFYGV